MDQGVCTAPYMLAEAISDGPVPAPRLENRARDEGTKAPGAQTAPITFVASTKSKSESATRTWDAWAPLIHMDYEADPLE